MKLIEAKYEIIPQAPGLEGMYKQIELAARNCYKSESFIKEGSAEKMIAALIKRGHGSPLEHGTIYLSIPYDVATVGKKPFHKYSKNHYSKVVHGDTMDINHAYITTNYRVLVENGWLDDLQYLCEPTEYHEKRYTVRFICSRSISHEIVRHRVMSFCQESQRYVNYSLDKFGSDITYIIPKKIKDIINDLADTYDPIEQTRRDWLVNMPLEEAIKDYGTQLDGGIRCWLNGLKRDEDDYMYLVNDCGWRPEQARGVLPNDCKTDVIVTGFASGWKYFFELRTAPGAHPDMRELACPLEAEFKLNNYI